MQSVRQEKTVLSEEIQIQTCPKNNTIESSISLIEIQQKKHLPLLAMIHSVIVRGNPNHFQN